MTVWLGNIVRIGWNTPRYLYNETKDTIYFRTMKDKNDIAFFDKKTGVLYLNGRYRVQYKAIKRQIKEDYTPKTISEYVDML